MILAELKKIKRHYHLPLSIGVVVLSCLLALIQLTGAENSVVGYLPLTDGILWNNVGNLQGTASTDYTRVFVHLGQHVDRRVFQLP